MNYFEYIKEFEVTNLIITFFMAVSIACFYVSFCVVKRFKVFIVVFFIFGLSFGCVSTFINYGLYNTQTKICKNNPTYILSEKFCYKPVSGYIPVDTREKIF